MPAEEPCVTVTKTVRLRLPMSGAASDGAQVTANRGKEEALANTRERWLHATGFYLNPFLDHPGVFDRKKTVTTRTGETPEKL